MKILKIEAREVVLSFLAFVLLVPASQQQVFATPANDWALYESTKSRGPRAADVEIVKQQLDVLKLELKEAGYSFDFKREEKLLEVTDTLVEQDFQEEAELLAYSISTRLRGPESILSAHSSFNQRYTEAEKYVNRLRHIPFLLGEICEEEKSGCDKYQTAKSRLARITAMYQQRDPSFVDELYEIESTFNNAIFYVSLTSFIVFFVGFILVLLLWALILDLRDRKQREQ